MGLPNGEPNRLTLATADKELEAGVNYTILGRTSNLDSTIVDVGPPGSFSISTQPLKLRQEYALTRLNVAYLERRAAATRERWRLAVQAECEAARDPVVKQTLTDVLLLASKAEQEATEAARQRQLDEDMTCAKLDALEGRHTDKSRPERQRRDAPAANPSLCGCFIACAGLAQAITTSEAFRNLQHACKQATDIIGQPATAFICAAVAGFATAFPITMTSATSNPQVAAWSDLRRGILTRQHGSGQNAKFAAALSRLLGDTVLQFISFRPGTLNTTLLLNVLVNMRRKVHPLFNRILLETSDRCANQDCQNGAAHTAGCENQPTKSKLVPAQRITRVATRANSRRVRIDLLAAMRKIFAVRTLGLGDAPCPHCGQRTFAETRVPERGLPDAVIFGLSTEPRGLVEHDRLSISGDGFSFMVSCGQGRARQHRYDVAVVFMPCCSSGDWLAFVPAAKDSASWAGRRFNLGSSNPCCASQPRSREHVPHKAFSSARGLNLGKLVSASDARALFEKQARYVVFSLRQEPESSTTSSPPVMQERSNLTSPPPARRMCGGMVSQKCNTHTQKRNKRERLREA